VKRDIPQLHAIRAAAMIGIFLHHLFEGIGPLRDANSGNLLGWAFGDLALGVAAFNIMTSFLLAMPYVGDNAAEIPKLREFVPKRLIRLCPHYYLAVILVVLGNAVVFRIVDPADWLPPALFHFFFLDPLRYQSFMSNTAAYWWLGLLFQFTLAWPLILRLARKYGLARLTVAATLIAWPLTEALKMWARATPDGLVGTLAFLSNFNLPSRLPEFLMGMWMAELWKQNPDRRFIVDKALGALIFGACGLCLVLSVAGLPVPWFAGIAWTLALFTALFACPATARLGARKSVLWLSGASYAIYLMHQPLLSWLDVAVPGLSPWGKFLFLGGVGWFLSVQAGSWLDKGAAWVAGKLAPRAAASK
jgi:peptidoglycan/LPS O-acetylase OafA/YrhL